MSQENNMFAYSEAVDLLQNSWGVRKIEERLTNGRKDLLDEIVRVIHENVAFQSITVLSSSDRNTPISYENIKKRCVSGVGVLCYDIASFTKGLLKALGFPVQMLSSTVTATLTAPNNHALLLTYDLENKGDVHLVDCGTGFPTFRAISLKFQDESPVFKDSFLEYKYIRSNGKILRMHGEGDAFKRNNPPIEDIDFIIGRWRRFSFFDPDQKLYHPDKPAEEAYRAVVSGRTVLTSSPRAVRFSGKRAVAIVNNKLMIENENDKMVTTVLTSDEEILKAYQVHFPKIEQASVRLALAEWRRVSQS